MKVKKPEGPTCYVDPAYAEGTRCPNLEDFEPCKPRCLKYEELLSWTRLGVVLKCQECLDAV